MVSLLDYGDSILGPDYATPQQPQMRFTPMQMQPQQASQRPQQGGGLLSNAGTISNLFGGGGGGGGSGLGGLGGLFGGGGGSGVASSSALDGMAGGDAGGGLSGLFGGGGGSGGLGAAGPAGLFAALIGLGKNTEANHPDTAMGKGLLGLLGPSISQVIKDPVGMGLPTLLGAPFLTPFTGSKEAQATKPEWSGLFGMGF